MTSENGRQEGDQAALGTHSHGNGPAIVRVAGGALLASIARWLAVAGGILLLTSVAITLISVVGRYAAGTPVPGDYELVEIICAVGIFLFLPYTHAVNGNITAEFFTYRLSERKKRTLDMLHDLIFAAIGVVITWRMGHGLADKFASGDASLLIRIPIWWAYSFAVLAIALLTLVCAWRVAAGMRSLRR